MAYHVEHLHSVQAVDDAITREAGGGSGGRLVIVRFGRDGHVDCARLDAALAAAGEQVAAVAVMYAVDTDEVTGYNEMYDLHGPCTVMFFYGNRHVDVRSVYGRDAVDWAAYTGAGFAGLVRAVHMKVMAGRTLFIVD
ncbi:unnamed protein product [Urochloa humidicola]